MGDFFYFSFLLKIIIETQKESTRRPRQASGFLFYIINNLGVKIRGYPQKPLDFWDTLFYEIKH